MSAAQQRQRPRGPAASQRSTQGGASQVASSQVDFQQAPQERQETRQGYRNLKADTYGTNQCLVSL